jgi:post-segregation antitoxin (ccd killing protein)
LIGAKVQDAAAAKHSTALDASKKVNASRGARPHGDRSERVAALAAGSLGCIVRRMPRMQVYLPDELYRLVKARRLPASELLQEAVRAEVRRRELLAKGDKYLAELVAEVGKPTARQRARASAIAQQAGGRTSRKVD